IGEGSANPTDPHHPPTIIQSSTSQPQNTKQHRRPRRKITEVPQPSDPTSVAYEAVNMKIDDSLKRATTTATSLDAEQDRGNISKTQSKATPNEPGSQGTSSGVGPRCQEAMRDTVAQTRSERVSKISNDPLLAGVNTPRSGEDSLKLTKLTELYTKLQQRVLDLETTKTTQALEIDNLKRRVKNIERKRRSRTRRLKRIYKVGLSARVKSSEDKGLGKDDAYKQGRIADIDADEDFYLVNVYKDKDMFGVNDSDVNAVSTATTTTATIDDITLAKALMEIKSAKPKTTTANTRPKAKGLVIHEQKQAPTPTVSSQQPSQVKDKGKGKIVKPEPVKKLSKKDQLKLDKELAFELQAEKEEKERIVREKSQQIEEVNIAWIDVQAKIAADYELAQRLQAEETDLVEESSKKAEAEIIQEGSLKRAEDEIEQERSKKQKVEDDKESEELKKYLKIIPDHGDDVTIDATPLSSKSSTIVNYKIYQEGKKSYF
nr:hypothetical protein [Tanacetum cinerariifolium]